MNDYKTFGEYRYSEKNNLPTILTFLLVGAGIGALVALMLAPQSGRKMRRNLRRRYEDARELVDDWGEQAGEYFDKGSKWASAAKEKVRPIGRALGRD